MTDARDDNFMALPGMEVDSIARDTTRHRSDDGAPASLKSALDALLEERRARAKSGRAKGVPFEERDRDMIVTVCGAGAAHTGWAVCSKAKVSLFVHHDGQAQQR